MSCPQRQKSWLRTRNRRASSEPLRLRERGPDLGALGWARPPDLLIRRFQCGRPYPFRLVRDLGFVSPGCPHRFGASRGCSSVWLPAWLPRPTRARALVVVFKSMSDSWLTAGAACAIAGCGWLTRHDHPAYIPRLLRSGLGVEPDGYARGPGLPDGIGAARAGVSDEGGAAVRAEGDHLGVAPVPGTPPVPVPVGGVCLGAVAGGSGRRRRRRSRPLRAGTRRGPAGRPRGAGPVSPPGPAR